MNDTRTVADRLFDAALARAPFPHYLPEGHPAAAEMRTADALMDLSRLMAGLLSEDKQEQRMARRQVEKMVKEG